MQGFLELAVVEHLFGLRLAVFVDEVLPGLEGALDLELLLHADLGADLPEAVAHFWILGLARAGGAHRGELGQMGGEPNKKDRRRRP
eukprot:6644478-Pyramimonas_sp.AAC.1